MYILSSALLFGLVHPGSKIVLSTGIPLSIFCLVYVAIRLVVQIPFVVSNKSYMLSGYRDFLLILALGLIGASLQVSEFAGIANGKNVSTVTFLVYSHPLWSMVISRFIFRESLTHLDYLKFLMACFGIVLIIGNDGLQDISIINHWPSLLAGLLIALWVRVSNIARKSGFGTLKVSFYYDLAAFVVLILYSSVFNQDSISSDLKNYLGNTKIFLIVSTYSILIGLIPNLLFYKGSSRVSPLSAGYVLLLEPIVASLVACFLFKENLTFTFMIGALFVLTSNIPSEFFNFKILKRSMLAITLAIFSFSSSALPSHKVIKLIEVIPTSAGDYTISLERRIIQISSRIALKKYSQTKTCNVQIEEVLKVGSEKDLSNELLKTKNESRDSIIIGLSRTNFARAAAFITKGTDIKAISVGASSGNLKKINRNFLTVVNPWIKQFEKIKEVMNENICNKNNTLGNFDKTNFLSNNFLIEFQEWGLGTINYSKDLSGHELSKFKCIFIGKNFNESLIALETIRKSGWNGHILGIGDWNIYSRELEEISKGFNRNIQFTVPTGWLPNINLNSVEFSKEFRKEANEDASPLSAYVYDGFLLALSALCENKNEKEMLNSKDLLRSYQGISIDGNLLSPMFVRSIHGKL